MDKIVISQVRITVEPSIGQKKRMIHYYFATLNASYFEYADGDKSWIIDGNLYAAKPPNFPSLP